MSYAEDRAVLMNSWNAVCVLIAIWYLSGNFLTASICFGFSLISGMLGYGVRWLSRIGFVVCLVALAVALGLPQPDRWREFAEGLPQAIARIFPFMERCAGALDAAAILRYAASF
jgi:hypothetical protein